MEKHEIGKIRNKKKEENSVKELYQWAEKLFNESQEYLQADETAKNA